MRRWTSCHSKDGALWPLGLLVLRTDPLKLAGLHLSRGEVNHEALFAAQQTRITKRKMLLPACIACGLTLLMLVHPMSAWGMRYVCNGAHSPVSVSRQKTPSSGTQVNESMRTDASRSNSIARTRHHLTVDGQLMCRSAWGP